MNKHSPFILLLLAGACTNTTDLGSGQNQDNLSDEEVLCRQQSELPCGVSVGECLSGLANQDALAESKGCTAEVNALLACFRDKPVWCEEGQAVGGGCEALQEAAGDCIFGASHGACGGSSSGLPGEHQECSAFCDDGGRAACSGDGAAVTCICTTGPRAGHEFALLSCEDLSTDFLAECYQEPEPGSSEACGGTGTTTQDGRDTCDASCANGVDISCEGPEGGPVVCACGESGPRFALTGCDELPSRAPDACL